MHKWPRSFKNCKCDNLHDFSCCNKCQQRHLLARHELTFADARLVGFKIRQSHPFAFNGHTLYSLRFFDLNCAAIEATTHAGGSTTFTLARSTFSTLKPKMKRCAETSTNTIARSPARSKNGRSSARGRSSPSWRQTCTT